MRRKNLLKVCAAFLWLFALAASAYADTDYACFKACVATGASNRSSCNDVCTYDTAGITGESVVTLDKSCFRTCVQGGDRAATCLPVCSKVGEVVKARKEASHSTADKHNLLDTPVPYTGLISKPQLQAQPVRDMDYDCLNACTHGGLQYQLCSQRCAK